MAVPPLPPEGRESEEVGLIPGTLNQLQQIQRIVVLPVQLFQ